jgi:peptide/nickel transport system permease protein
MVVLLTDAAVWALAAGTSAFLAYAVRQEHYRIAWQRLKRRPLAMACGGILALFLLVGLLDSFHFRRESETVSLLDLALWDLKMRTERTYSAPLAARQFSRETAFDAEGRPTLDYPRLQHGGRHLEDPADAPGDIALRILGGLALGAFVGGGALLAVVCVQRLRGGPVLPAVRVGLFLAAVFLVVCVVAVVAARYHVFGTDKIGSDVLYRALKSCRTGLIVGTLTTIIVTPFALLFGVAAGYLGGWIDDIVQYVYTTLASIPDILLIAAVMLIVQAGLTAEATAVTAEKRLFFLCAILGLTGWTELCRLLRAETLKVRELEYVVAAQAFGASPLRIMLKHILPNVVHIILISVVLRFSGLVLFEAVLTYVGIGVDPTTESWGSMINSARMELSRDPMVWWTLAAAFLFMFGLVLSANIFGDAVRDSLDPRLLGRSGAARPGPTTAGSGS